MNSSAAFKLAIATLDQAHAVATGLDVGMAGYCNWMIEPGEKWFEGLPDPTTPEGAHHRVVALCMAAAILKAEGCIPSRACHHEGGE